MRTPIYWQNVARRARVAESRGYQVPPLDGARFRAFLADPEGFAAHSGEWVENLACDLAKYERGEVRHA